MKRTNITLLLIVFFSVFIFRNDGIPVAGAAIDFKMEVVATSGIDFYAIWGSSASDVFAGAQDGVLYHYNGTAWSNISGYKALTKNDIKAFWGTSGSDVYAVCFGYGAEKILHYNGTTLSALNITIPDEPPYDDEIKDFGFKTSGACPTRRYTWLWAGLFIFLMAAR